jgi:Mlc titration factor MtfA (ptsG expression regulator)
MWNWWKRRRRQRIVAEPFPSAWRDTLLRNVAQYRLLPPQQSTRLHDDLRILAAEKKWVGCRGLTVTDEMKVTIAAQASLILLGSNRHDYFRRVQSILVYPSEFRVPASEPGEERDRFGMAGQSVYRGPVILAWDAVLEEGRDCSLGSNVVIHEFAHQLDDLDGSVNGTPALETDSDYDSWRRVMTAEYTRLLRELRKGRETFLGEYASQNETEFFAVASERFFTRPTELRHYHEALYGMLAGYYNLDPVAWFADGESAVEQREKWPDSSA